MDTHRGLTPYQRELAERWFRYATAEGRRFAERRGLDVPDAQGTAVDVLLRLVVGYKPGLGAEGPYFVCRMGRHLELYAAGEIGRAGAGDMPPGDGEAADAARRKVERMLGCLTPNRRENLRLRFGLGGNPPHTSMEIAAVMGNSRRTVDQTTQRAIERLRRTWAA
jgi:hypothetical protein